LNKDDINFLKQSPVFSALNENELQDMVSLVKERRLVPDEVIFWEDDPSDWFYIVLRGKVKVTKMTSAGKEIILSFFGPGEIIGEVAVFENKPYPATAQSVIESRLISIRKSDFLNFLLKHPEVSLKIIGVLSGRLRESQSRLRDLAGEKVEQRLARLLLMLSSKLGSTLPFTRQELSDMTGTTTETTIRVLSQWKNRSIIRSVRGEIIIADESKLKLIAEGPPLV
jgi:CRP/FNR family transcriptional regulator, nitrogen oxide reductase regulator